MVQLDRASGVPVYLQLEEGIRLRIRRGELTAGEALPTVRSLAGQLGVNANTVARVYRELQREGLLRLERGLGTFVTESAGDRALPPEELEPIERLCRELVSLGRRAGMALTELARLLEGLWKEESDGTT